MSDTQSAPETAEEHKQYDDAVLRAALQTQGYPIACFVDPPEDHLVCAICSEVVRDPPNLVKCAHLFCRACLAQCHKSQCPTCREPWPADKAIADLDSIPFVQLIICNRPIHCLFQKDGCAWTGTIGTDERILQQHLQACTFGGYKPCSECGDVVDAAHLAAHLADECPERSVTCQHCHQAMHVHVSMAHRVLGEYNDNPCVNTERCRFGCGAAFLRADVTRHCELECPRRLVPCQVCIGDQRHHMVEWGQLNEHYREKLATVDDAVRVLMGQAWDGSCAEWGRFVVGDLLDAQDLVTKKWNTAHIADKRCAPNPLQHNLVFDEIRLRWLTGAHAGTLSDWRCLDTARGYAPHGKFTRPTLCAADQSIVSQSVNNCLLRGECTLYETVPTGTFASQPWFQCETCTPNSPHAGCCVSCADKCHKGHKLVARKGSFYCDCATLVGTEPTAKTRCCLKRKSPEADSSDSKDAESQQQQQPPQRALRRPHEGEVRLQMGPDGNMMLVFENLLEALREQHLPTPADETLD